MENSVEPPRILLIDDDRNILEAYQRSLRRHFPVDVAEGPRVGLTKILSGEPYAVVVVDLLMPGISGLEILRRLKEFSPNTVGILFTGLGDYAMAVDALNQGYAYRFLQKPTPVDKLLRALQDSLAFHRLLAGQENYRSETLEPLLRLVADQLTAMQEALFGRSVSLSGLMRQVCEQLKLPNPVDFEIAGVLASLAWCSAPENVQRKLYGQRPGDETVALTLTEHEGRLRKALAPVASLQEMREMLARPDLGWAHLAPGENLLTAPRVDVGAHLLHLASEYAMHFLQSHSPIAAVTRLRARKDHYHPAAVAALEIVLKLRTAHR